MHLTAQTYKAKSGFSDLEIRKLYKPCDTHVLPVLTLVTPAGDEEDADRLHPRGVPEPEGSGGGPPQAGPDHVLSPAAAVTARRVAPATAQTG